MGSHQRVLAFDSDSPEFVRGFEAGWLYQRLAADEQVDGQPFHAVNAEMVMRMLDALGRTDLTASFTSDPVWMVLRETTEK